MVRRYGIALALIGICAFAFGLRVWNLDWDEGQHLHPDERYWSFVLDDIEAPANPIQYFDSADSPLNPYNHRDTWVYGTFPLFLTEATASVVGEADYDANLVGRALSAVFDTGTVLLVFLLGRALFSTRVGLIAALLQATTVLHIQYSHFFGAETIVTFFVTAVVLGSVWIAQGKATPRTYAWVGAALGLAMASKLNAVTAVAVPIVAVAIIVYADRSNSRRAVALGAMSLAAAAVTFRVFQPYAFDGVVTLDPRFTSDIDQLQDINDGGNVPWVIQWIGRNPLWHAIQTAVRWGLGPPLALLAATGLVRGAVDVWRRRKLALLVPITLLVLMLVLVSQQFNPLIRYLLPVYPVLVTFAGLGAVWLWDTARAQWRVLAAALVAASIVWALAFTNGVYNQDNPRIAASRWMADNIPAGATVSAQVWDDGLPLPLPDTRDTGITRVSLDLFEPDSPAKITELVATLDQVDYFVESSNRVYDSLPRVPARYPQSLEFYDQLFDGSLGFEEVASFRNTPGLLGIHIDDSSAEETFTVYDHPTVRIWAKTDDYSTEQALALLNPDRAATAIDVIPRDAGANALQLTPGEYSTQQAGGTWTDVFDPGGWPTSVPWLWWLLGLQLAAFAALPWTVRLLRGLPDRGYGASKIIGALGVALPTWLLVAWGVVDASAAVVWVVFGVFVATGAVLGYRRRAELTELWRRHWKSWLAVEGLFVLVYFAILGLRAANPDLWHPFTGGEKPMEMAYLTAIAKSTTLPVYDPWFAGGSMNYYYFGWYGMSLPMRALRLPPEIAFNLGGPTFAALAAGTAFSAGHALVSLIRRGWAIAGGLFSALLLLLVSNFDAVRLQIDRIRAVDRWEIAENVPVLGYGLDLVGGTWAWATGAQLEPFDWWGPSRINKGTFDVTEFPFWSFLFGDLHPHVMGISVLGLTIVLGIAFVCRPGWPLAIALGVATAVVRMVHTWDLPIAVALTALFIGLGQALAAGPIRRRTLTGLGQLVTAGLVHLAIVQPYLATTEVFDAGVVEAPVSTNLDDFFAQFGVFLAIAAAFFVFAVRRALHQRVPSDWEAVGLATGVVVAGIAWAYVSAVAGLSAAAVFAAMWLGWREVRHGEANKAVAVSCVLYCLAFGITAAVDVVTVQNDVERLNTVFKFWLQSWQLFAVASAPATAVVAISLARLPKRTWLRAGAVGLAVLLAAGLVYPLVGTPARVRDRFEVAAPSLDGLAYLESGPEYTTFDATATMNLGDDLPLIEWLRDNVEGSPTIVEAVGPIYEWTSRMTTYTGLPTVIGWDNHQIQQRRDYEAVVRQRYTDTQRFYLDPDPAYAEQYLRTYDVSYVVVGTLEHGRGAPEALAMLDELPALDAVFRDGDYAIYQVDKTAVTAARPAAPAR